MNLATTKFNPTQIAARTAWGEARGEGSRGMQAVLNVIASRTKQPCWWGNDIISVCLKPFQFSCWNKNDPNYKKIMEISCSDKQFQDSLQLADQMICNKLPDLTQSSDHYFDIRSKTPAWATKTTYRCTIGNHAFYRIGPYGQEKK